MRTFDIEVTRHGRWWLITVPTLAGYVAPDGSINATDTTQARYEAEIDSMARDFIATVLDVPIEEIVVRQAKADPPQRYPPIG